MARLVFMLFILVGCAHSQPSKVEYICPDGTSVWVEPLKSENKYVRFAAENGRGLSSCIREESQGKAHSLVDVVLGDGS